MPAATRDRIVAASAELFSRQGYAGTGIKQIVQRANAPFGSIYHFFPGGKSELGEVVIRGSGAVYLELIDAVFAPAPDCAAAVSDFFAGAAEHLRETDYADACPIATVALEVASTSEPLREATADVFQTWLERAAHYFMRDGISEVRARELAISTLSALEGAFVLARASRSTEALDVAGAGAAAHVRAALPG